MAVHLTVRWPASLDAPGKRDRRGGTYHPYLPDPLVGRPLRIDDHLSGLAAKAEHAVRSLLDAPESSCLESLARFLLRSEAIASSRIEGLQVSAQQVALAELAQTEETEIRGFSENARLVANNIRALRQATTELVPDRPVTVADIERLHQALLPEEKHQGLRTLQNWVGGSAWHPLDAAFVPPPPEQVRPLMEDLARYISGGGHAPLIQAGLVHAQFETIHPFADGNGRVGRALIHTVLSRRGLTRHAVVPVSLVLFTRADAYISGLTKYRHDGPSDSEAAQLALSEWLLVFLDALMVAADQTKSFVSEMSELRSDWEARYAKHRADTGRRGRPRASSTVVRLLAALPEVPLLTTRTGRRLLGASEEATRTALEELADAGILSRRKVDRKTTGYFARDVFDLLTFTERRIASTRFDTRESRPSRPVPAHPD